MMRRGLILLLLPLLYAGCSSSSFVGRRVNNFTAYYNTFFNAEKSFKEGLKTIEKKDAAVNRDLYMALFTEPDRASNVKGFEDAITKSADVLRGHSNSKWVDDALLLIGKSYFYQQNYVGAEQKFREVIGLGGKLQNEAQFWLARSLIASGAYEAAASHLQESLNREGLSSHWESMLRLALGELYVKRSEWEEAAAQLEQGLERVGGDLGARAQFLLGQVYETMGKHRESIAAFERVQRYRPLYDLSYAAQVSAIREEGLYGDAERALRMLRRMERDDKNYGNRAELMFLRGRVYHAQGRADDALEAYDDLLYGRNTDLNISNIRGRIHYALGELFRDEYQDFLLASAHFDTAATALPQVGSAGIAARGASSSGISAVNFTKAAITDGSQQAQVFRSFSTIWENVSLMDSLLQLGSLDDEAFKYTIHEIRVQRGREMEAQRREQSRRQAEQGFQGVEDLAQRNTGPGSSPGSQQDANSGFLFHKNPVRVQDGWASFVNRWGERPLAPNWRRLEALSAIAQTEAEGLQGDFATSAAVNMGDVGLPVVDFSAVPRDSLSTSRMLADRAVARYEMANSLFLAMQRPDSAAIWYRRVIEEDGDQPVAQRAYYALAEVQRSLGDTLAANRIYEQMLREYPGSEFTSRIRERLGMPVAVEQAPDSTALAEEAYAHAYQQWERGRHATAIREMLSVAASYPTTETAPRALLAAGSVYSDWAKKDSLDLLGSFPLALPDSLLKASGLVKREKAKPAAAQEVEGPLAASDSLAGTRQDSVAVPPGVRDSLLVQREDPADSLAAVADTMAFAADTVIAVADTTALVAEAPVEPADSLRQRTDSLSVSESARMDSVAAIPETTWLNLEDLYASISDVYPESAYARRARIVLKVLEEERAAMQALKDSMAASAAALVDSAAVEPSRMDTSSAGLTLAPDDALGDSVAVQAGQETTVSGVAEETGLSKRELLRRQEREEARASGEAAAPDSTGPIQAVPDTFAVQQQRMHRQPASGDPVSDSLSASPSVPVDSSGVAAVLSESGRQAEESADSVSAPSEVSLSAVDREGMEQADSTVSRRNEGAGWTLIIGSEAERNRAQLQADRFSQAFDALGWPVLVLEGDSPEGKRYRVAAGHFSSKLEAQDAIDKYANMLPQDVWMMHLPQE